MSFFSDVRFAGRTLLAKPAFTGIAVLSLALGIGANTAIFSVVESALLRELPYDHADRLFILRDHQPINDSRSLAPGEFLDYQRQTKMFSGLAAYTHQQLALTGAGEPQRIRAASVTPNFFEVLGAHPEMGRLLDSKLDKPGQDRTAVLSDATWRGAFGSDPQIIGRTITLNGNSFRVVGVLRPSEGYWADRQVWITPRILVPEVLEDRRDVSYDVTKVYGNHFLSVLGRLKPGVSQAAARSELGILGKQIGLARENSRDHFANIVPLHDRLIGPIKPALLILLGAVTLLLLIACANLAGLLLSRSASRTRELAVRAVLGATKLQIVRLLLAESLLLGLGGGMLGIFLAYEGQHQLAAHFPFDLPAALLPEIDTHVLAFCVAATLLSALVSGLVPAFRSAQIDVQEGLKEGSKSSPSSGTNRLRRGLVAAEIALSVMLLTGAGLLIHSFRKVLDVDPGFASANLVTGRISLPLTRYSHESAGVFWDKLLRRVSALPDIESAAITTNLPLNGGGEQGSDIKAEGGGEQVSVNHVGASKGFFQTMQIALLSGRDFDGSETEKAPAVALLNRTLAEKLFPNQNPIGKKILGGLEDPTTVIGVVADVRSHGLSEPPPLVTYYSYPQYGVDSASLVIRTRHDAGAVGRELRAVLHALDPALPLSDLKPMSDLLGNSLAFRRFLLGLITAFAALAILLAAVGIYGVLAFSVEQRTREIGIRVALGAERQELVGLVLGDSSFMAAAGLLVGLTGAFWASSFLKGLLYGVTDTDYLSYGSAIVLVLFVTLLSSLLPAWRATRIDPIKALRYE